MLIPGRHEASGSYRYGFQGQEKDDEIKGEGNSLNYTFRMHDPRVGRFFAVDPLTFAYPWNSAYSFSENDVIRSIELEGGEKKIVIHEVNGSYQDGTPKIVSTHVDIDKNWNLVTDQGILAKTEVFYAFKNGDIYKGKSIWEWAHEGQMPPSAGIDYTILDSDEKANDEKLDADFDYAGFNLISWAEILSRDMHAPDQAMLMEDLSALEAVAVVMGYGYIGSGVKQIAKVETETYYRAMSTSDYKTFLETGKIPASSETFISPTASFSENYRGVLVEIKTKKGTYEALKNIGVGDGSNLVNLKVGELPKVEKGWNLTKAYFKKEGKQVNIGLGKGDALETFNNNILGQKIIIK